MHRRSFVQLLIGGLLTLLSGCVSSGGRARSRYEFLHGVASGDPLADRVIIWTRISGATGEILNVSWRVAEGPDMRAAIASGQVVTDAGRDYTVKVDVTGLPAGRRLYYQFEIDGIVSVLGKTRTLPAGAAAMARLAVTTCANYPYGFFHAYREIAGRDDIDLVIHLGDYLYEYGLGEYATEYAEGLGRVPDPRGELGTQSDYRLRHAQYKTDADLQALHAAHPMICIWDDHEIANDAWRDGSPDHDESEGPWGRRRDAAIEAYFEWMPIRGEAQGGKTRVFRQFRYGDLMSLIMLDTRFYGRDVQPQLAPDISGEEIVGVLNDPDRRMLGAEQEEWLRAALRDAKGTTWQVIGQQVLMSPTRAPDLEPLVDPEGPSMMSREALDHNITLSKNNPPMLLDTWDGYGAARQDLLGDLQRLATNAVVLSGDLHTSMAGNLHLYGEAEAVAVEFMPTSITSPGFAEYLPERYPGAVSGATLELNPALRYMETDRRGWLHLTVTPTECTGEWHLLDGIHSREYSVTVDKRLSVRAGEVGKGLFESPGP